MHLAPKISIAIMIAALITACSLNKTGNADPQQANQPANPANSATSNSVKDDIDELELTIKIPFHPEEAVWREELLGKTGGNSVSAPTGKKMVAVLRFLREDSDKIVAQAEKFKPAAEEKINTESWFPAELIAQSQTSGDKTLKGKSYPANDFFNAPFTEGKITRIDGTDYFVLELFAK